MCVCYSLSIMEANDQDYYYSIMVDSRNMTNKGKRTKCSRPSSPLTLTMGSTSSATTTTAISIGEDGGDHTNKPTNTFNMPTTSSIEFTKLFREKEEEDMANCLILLAQGQSSPPPPPHTSVAVEVARGTGLGFYGYECKTCYRGFSSFQALGGHRASHKVKQCKPNHSSTTLSLQTGLNCSNQMSYCNPSGSIKATKIHECSTCGAEFGSGQALGGHMRRHRPMHVAITNCNGSGGCQESKKPKTLPSLDLNLPAPIEDDQRETNFPFRSKDRMITFSNSSLVHCHL